MWLALRPVVQSNGRASASPDDQQASDEFRGEIGETLTTLPSNRGIRWRTARPDDGRTASAAKEKSPLRERAFDSS
jgi:hypothetical protein